MQCQVDKVLRYDYVLYCSKQLFPIILCLVTCVTICSVKLVKDLEGFHQIHIL